MITYLKNIEGWKHKDLKSKDFDYIKELFDKAFKRVNTFVDFRTDLVEGSSKRAGEELEQESTKKQKVDEDKDTADLQSLMEITPDEEEVTIDAVPLAVKSPSTTVMIDVQQEPNPESPTRNFRMVYMCLGALKQGFKACGKEIIGLDGCFMSGPFPGQILTVVGVDANNEIYPVAYVIVEAESKASWCWFFNLLGEGLIQAIASVFPSAEHKFCVKHIHENMKSRFKGVVYKDMLWNVTRATTIVEFNKKMAQLKSYNSTAYDWKDCNGQGGASQTSGSSQQGQGTRQVPSAMNVSSQAAGSSQQI
ncbi:mutator type transposase [Tanacetum coccineum]